jgi:hypothetical protein
VDGVADIQWVQPRVLDRTQISALAVRLHTWSDSVAGVVGTIRTEAPELFAA